MKSFIAIFVFVGCASLTFAAPSASDEKTETLHNLQQVHSILSQTAQEIEQTLETKEPAKIVPILENEIKSLTEVLPKLQNNIILQGVTTLIKEAQELVQKLPNGGKTELEAFIGKTLNGMLYISFMQTILDATKPAGAEPY